MGLSCLPFDLEKKHPENLINPLKDVVHGKHLTAQEPEKHPFYKWLAINFHDSKSSTKKMVLSPCSIHLKTWWSLGLLIYCDVLSETEETPRCLLQRGFKPDEVPF